ncbi:MAG: DUF533 domain-containing protein [Hyphomicrobiaceae bacterium]|nr:DUF533 domain-containing protein [Hyphomicrobiaceae bacterium]
MFDAKSLLEALVNGAQQRAAAPTGGAPQGDPLRDLLGGLGGGQASGGPGGPLGDLLRNMLPNQQGRSDTAGPQGDPLSDILGKLGGGGPGPAGGAPGSGGLMDILGEVFKQAAAGAKEGAGHINQQTGAGAQLQDMIRQMSGKSPDELMATVRDLVANNKLGTGAALGGLGALILGTQTGRSVAVGAAKMGALALIAGLAYKAYQNYQQGRSPMDLGGGVETPPAGSGFEPTAVSNEQAARLVRAMIAAAAADGRVDEAEQQAIMANLKIGGMDAAAEEFLANELNSPATIEALVTGVTTREEAVQLYTAARLAIEPDTTGEQRFLIRLADRLGLDDALVGNIDATAQKVGS